MSAIQQMTSSMFATQKDTKSAAPKTDPNVDPLANKATFLQLLVAQLKNQDPESPTDGTQFVTQLAQFSSLETGLASRQDLDAIAKSLDALVAQIPPPATS
jgi:flagellar basal-body rod modification protein FlgD